MTKNTSRAHLNKMRLKDSESKSQPSLTPSNVISNGTSIQQPASHVKNILAESPMDRRLLGTGELIDVYVGQQCVISIPASLFKAASSNVDDILEGLNIILPNELVDPTAVRYLLTWLGNLSTKKYVKRPRASYDFKQDMATLLVAHLLGLSKYTKHIESYHCQWIMETVPSLEDIESVMAAVKRYDDPIMRALASRIAYLIRHDEFPHSHGWDDYISRFPVLADTIEEVDAPHREVQRAKNERRAERKAYKEWRAAEHAAFLEREARRQARRLADEARVAGRSHGHTNPQGGQGKVEDTVKTNGNDVVPKAPKDPRTKLQRKEDAIKDSIAKKRSEGVTKFTFDEVDYARTYNLL